MTAVGGLHHVTAIAGDAQRNVNFYAGVLGLRLVKRTVNFDDPTTYHLYYGDELGTPGSLMTFFPWPAAHRGRQGVNQIAITSFAVLPNTFGFWIERFLRYGVAYEGPLRSALGSERILRFKDPDGLILQLVGDPAAERRNGWDGASGIPPDNAIRGLHGVTLWLEETGPTERLLSEALGFRAVSEDEGTRRFAIPNAPVGGIVDLRAVGGFLRGSEGPGTVHHVALAVRNASEQLAVRANVIAAGLHPTEIIDRRYFQSVYFREPAGVLFEVATEAPGFTVDEPAERLGEELMLPAQYQALRIQLETTLPPIEIPHQISR
ncbi:MAG: ring-cleaving dioxygenase [Gemmatimonadota bacterium]